MSMREIVRQLNSVKAGTPIHRYSTMHLRIDDNPMVVAFIRMAGESRPWAIAFGRLLDASPKVLSIADGRNRLAVVEMCEEFAEDLLEYFRVAGYTWDPITKDNLMDGDLPQIWVPSARHVEMFHHLQYAFWRVRKGDDRTKPITVFARLCGWLFRESTKVGQQAVVDTSKLFRDSYVFPADIASLGHLGTCIAWFKPSSNIAETRLSVRQASILRDSPTLDPDIDSKILNPLIQKRADLMDQGKSTEKIDAEIAAVLHPEVARRWELVREGYKILCNDTREVNVGVHDLVLSTMQSFYSGFQRIEENLQDPDLGPAYTQHPETDFHGSAAASNYFEMTAADTAFIAKLVHTDEELQAEALAAGNAFIAEIIKVENLGTGRSVKPMWTLQVEIGENLRIREGERYAPLMGPLHGIQVRNVTVLDSNNLEVLAEWTDRKTVPLEFPLENRAIDPEWEGHRIMFVPKDSSEFDKSKSRAVWAASSGPGAWLTHGVAPVPVDANIVDDITQLSGTN